MSQQFLDSCDCYAATADLLQKWKIAESGWSFSATGGVTGTGAIVGSGATAGQMLMTHYFSIYLPNSNSYYIATGFWVKISAKPTTLSPFLRYWGQNENGANYQIDTNGFLRIYNRNGALVVQGTVDICDNAFHWIETRHQNDDFWSSNISTIRVDNADDVIDNGAVGTNAKALDRFIFYTLDGPTVTLDDIINYDSYNTAYPSAAANWPLDARQMHLRSPNSDVSVDFTPSVGGTNYPNVDEIPASSVDYNQSGVVGDQDLYGFPALGFTPTEVNGVTVNIHSHNPNAGTIHQKALAKSGTTTGEGSSQTTPALHPRVQQTHFSLNPDTSAQWTGSEVDGGAFGIKNAG